MSEPVADRQLGAASVAPEELLQIRNLTVAFPTSSGLKVVVNEVSLDIRRGETHGLVGESGSGKSMMCRGILGVVPYPGATIGGEVRWNGVDLTRASARELRGVRGRQIGMVYQDPTSALNPVLSVGDQIAETLQTHGDFSWKTARKEAAELLERVGIPAAQTRVDAYSHELSGGMRQRAMIAIAIACRPQLLLADEPTTNLDVTIQAQVLALLADLQAEYGLAMLLVSHDLGVVARAATRVSVMYAGRIVEQAPTRSLFGTARHPYTAGLLRALPRLGRGTTRELLTPIPGQPPDVADLPAGCPFQPRCEFCRPQCAEVDMTLLPVAPDHTSACPFLQ